MRKIRLAHLVYDLGFAGKEQGIIKIVNHMDADRFEVDIVVFNRVYEDAFAADSSFEVVKLPKKAGNDPLLIPRLAALFKRKKYDIIYTHSWNTLLEGYLAAVIAGVPVKIHGEHGTFEHSKMKDILQRHVWARFDAVTVVADALRQKMLREFHFHHNNITVIHNGIDRRRFYPSREFRTAFRQRYGLEGRFVIGTVGRFHPVKDHFTLIRGFARFHQSVPDAHLVLVGRETYRGLKQQYLNLIVDLGIQNHVLFVPPSREVEKLYNGFDVFCLSSVSEGCSNVILEALACGVPVVATRTGGNPELVQHGETGLLFEVHDADGLARQLLQLYQNSDLLHALQEAGPRTIAAQFSLERTVDKYQRLYESLLQRRQHKMRQKPEAASARSEHGR